MRTHTILLVALLLASPVVLMPASGAPVVDACVDRVCAAADDRGAVSAGGCLADTACLAADATACAESPECAAANACAAAAVAGASTDASGTSLAQCVAAGPGLCVDGLGCEALPDVLPPIRPEGPIGPVKPVPCRDPIGIVYIADDVDNFASQAASSPGTDLAAWMATIGAPQRGFDHWGSNRHFGHTFDNLPGNIVAATLGIHLHATRDIPGNDALHLQLVSPAGAFAYGTGIAAAATAQGGQAWPGMSPSYTDVTLAFDLGAAPHDLRSSMSSLGRLDVFIQDDTVVDYITLEIWWCECREPPVSMLLEQGTQDNFVGPEPTTYRWGTEPRQYDDKGADRAFATTLKLSRTDCLREAWVEIQTRVEHSLVSTDWISIQNTGSGFLQSQPVPIAPTGTVQTINIALSPAVIADMAATGAFDVYIQDDTAVDYVRLIVSYY